MEHRCPRGTPRSRPTPCADHQRSCPTAERGEHWTEAALRSHPLPAWTAAWTGSEEDRAPPCLKRRRL
ncbi:hypothetical protein NDU88_004349 [Pleurodeles waltl]|uniref:Uncharacterized protein n=1 Tax=Pleurodeles waltl TaxID=8319 RepID=A0AAV7LJK5_PLEWA|nr:hypothetical protein NDU88_004349 [Pleurodeles waltl]